MFDAGPHSPGAERLPLRSLPSSLPDFVEHRECNRACFSKGCLPDPACLRGRYLAPVLAVEADGWAPLFSHRKISSASEPLARHQMSTGVFADAQKVFDGLSNVQ